jgi:thiol-disulfide isomerase/thioredoxin
MKKIQILLRGVLGLIFVTQMLGCFVMEGKFTRLAPGAWRGTIQLVERQIVAQQDNEIHTARQYFTNKNAKTLPDMPKIEESSEGELPFNFEVTYVNDTSFAIELINGTERIKVEADEIHYGRDRSTGKDTFKIEFPHFGSYLRGVTRERVMEGEFVIPAKKLTLPFKAHHGQNHRFTNLNKPPKADISGKWAVNFNIADSSPYKAIGEFQQNGNILRGTFRTETGDYRFLAGEVQANKFYLSTFDGSHTFLFEGKIGDDNKLLGFFRSGRGEPELWEAVRDDQAALKSAESLTTATSQKVNFNFPNADGKVVALSEFGNKVKILQVMGTWCPNCWDETKFLVNYLKNNPSLADKIAVVPLAFERNADVAAQQIKTYQKKMQLPYQMLIAGTTTDKKEAAQSLPFLSGVVAYPTMVFLDKNNSIRRIHTGFDGPATSQHAAFASEFDTFVKQLISE